MKYGKRSLWRVIISSPFTLIFLFIIFTIMVKATWSIYKKADLSNEKLTQAQNQLAQLEARQADLTAKVGYLSTSEGVETEIRTKFRAVKDGESVAVIVDKSPSTTSTATSTANVGWFKRLLNKIGL